MVSRNSIPGGFAYIWQSKWLGIIAIKTESTQINFLSDVLVAVASLDLKVPNIKMNYSGTPLIRSLMGQKYFAFDHINGLAVLPGQAQFSRLEGRYDKYTVHRIHVHRIFHFQKISKPYHGWLFEILRAELETWRHWGILMIEGILPLEFPQGTARQGGIFW